MGAPGTQDRSRRGAGRGRPCQWVTSSAAAVGPWAGELRDLFLVKIRMKGTGGQLTEHQPMP